MKLVPRSRINSAILSSRSVISLKAEDILQKGQDNASDHFLASQSEVVYDKL